MLHNKELEALVLRECDVYSTPKERAANRAGMSTAAAACDYASREFGQRNLQRRHEAAAAKLCGDMIEGLRSNVSTTI